MPLGSTLSLRIDCAAGTVSVRMGEGLWAQVWTDITPSEIAAGLHAGVLLDKDADVKILSFEQTHDSAAPHG
jgi:hypothetical protein